MSVPKDKLDELQSLDDQIADLQAKRNRIEKKHKKTEQAFTLSGSQPVTAEEAKKFDEEQEKKRNDELDKLRAAGKVTPAMEKRIAQQKQDAADAAAEKAAAAQIEIKEAVPVTKEPVKEKK